MTSGSLFASGGTATDGAIDRGRVDAGSTGTTDSAVFRVYTRAWFEPSYSIQFDAGVAPLRPIDSHGVKALHQFLRNARNDRLAGASGADMVLVSFALHAGLMARADRRQKA